MKLMLQPNQSRNLAISSTPSSRDNRSVRGMRIYLAARFARQPELRAVAEELQHAGAEVTSQWLYGERPLEDCELTNDGRGAELARMDVADLQAAEVCIAFTEHGSKGGRGGRHTELGMALALDLRVILIGPREHVFHCLPSVEHYESWEAARCDLIEGTDVADAVRVDDGAPTVNKIGAVY